MQPTLAPVRVAAMQSAAHALVPRALGLLAERDPELRVELAELAPAEGLLELAARRFDLLVPAQYPTNTRNHPPGAAPARHRHPTLPPAIRTCHTPPHTPRFP